MSGRVVISVDQDGWTKGYQLSIGDDGGGYRLSGRKFNGSSKAVLRCVLTRQRDLSEIEAYCRQARAAIAKATTAVEPNSVGTPQGVNQK